LPAVQAVLVLFAGTNGRPLVVMDGTEITYWRTAADSALGAKLLASAEPATLLVVGAGEMSMRLVHAHRAVRPSLERVLVWNRTLERAVDVAAQLTREGLAAEAVEELAAATRIADIISCCTRSHDPLVRGADLKPGVHLDLVGGHKPDTRRSPAARFASPTCWAICTTWSAVVTRAADPPPTSHSSRTLAAVTWT